MYSDYALLSKTCDLFSRIFEVFNEIEMENERIDLLITANVNIYKTKKSIPIIMKTCSSQGKLMKQFGNPSPLSRRTHPLPTNPPISEQFFHDPPLCPDFKNKIPSPPNFRWGDYALTKANYTVFVNNLKQTWHQIGRFQ